MFEQFIPNFNKKTAPKSENVKKEESKPENINQVADNINTIKEPQTENRVETYAQKEEKLRSLIKIFVSNNDLEGTEERQIFEELRLEAELLEDKEGNLSADPVATLEKMNQVLYFKAQSIIENWRQNRYKKIKVDPDLVKKAKIILLANNDISDFKLEKSYDYKDADNLQVDVLNEKKGERLANYLDIKSYYQDYDTKKDLNANEGRVLLNIGLDKALVDLESLRGGKVFSELPNELMSIISQKKLKDDSFSYDSYNLKNVIMGKYDSEGFSPENLKNLVRLGFGNTILKFPEAFEKKATLEDWKFVIKYYAPDYPYHIEDITKSILNLNISENDKKELINYTYQHNINTIDNTNHWQDLKNNPYLNEIKKIKLKIDIKWPNSQPWYQNKDFINLTEEEVNILKGAVNKGYLGLLSYDYLKKLAETDYDWLINVAVKYDQENLLLSRVNLKPEDQSAYALKLLKANELRILTVLIEKGHFDNQSLTPEIFEVLINEQLENKNYRDIDPSFFQNLTDDHFKLYLQNISQSTDIYNYLDTENPVSSSINNRLFKTISSFDLSESSDNENFIAYQKLANLIKAKFKNKAREMVSYLNLEFSNFQKASEIEQEITKLEEKSILLDNFLAKNLNDYQAGSFDLDRFSNLTSLALLVNDSDILQDDLNSLEHFSDNYFTASPQELGVLRGYKSEEKRALAGLIRFKYELLNENGQPWGRKQNLNTKNLFPLIKSLTEIDKNNYQNSFAYHELLENFKLDLKDFQTAGGVDLIKLTNEIRLKIEKNIVNVFSVQDPNIFGSEMQRLGEAVVRGDKELSPEENDYFLKLNKKYQFFTDNFIRGDIYTLQKKYDEKNWAEGLINYVILSENEQNNKLKANFEELMSGPYRNVCLNKMTSEWRSFLENKEQTEIPLKLKIVADNIESYGGAGFLSKIESLSALITEIDNMSNKDKTVSRTKTEIKELLSNAEMRFEKEKWSFNDKAYFYAIAKDSIEAAPSLFSSFAPLLDQLSNKEMKLFLKEIMPLYQTRLLSLQKNDDNENVSYNPKDLVNLRKSLKSITDNFKNNDNHEEVFNQEKNKLEIEIRKTFKDTLGIIKIPEKITPENLRSIRDIMIYYNNINGRNDKSGALLGLYLGLELNKEWKNFRSNQNLKIDEYLTPENSNKLKEAINNKLALPLNLLNLSKKNSAEFQNILQDETVSNMVGNIETIDIKLGNIKRNVDDLLDKDAFNDEIDKNLIDLIKDNGKIIGSTLAKTYQNLSGRDLILNNEEVKIQTKLKTILGFSEWDTEKVKMAQERIQPLSLINDLTNKMAEYKVEQNISELNARLNPSQEIIKIFNRLDENFKVNSGAFAISRDLEYLEQLAVKGSDKLESGDKDKIDLYLKSIKEKMAELEDILSLSKEYFLKIKNSTHLKKEGGNSLLINRLEDLEKVYLSSDNAEMMISELTNDPNLIIENMRQCLGCLRKEINNDTNLTFGDYNKFFLLTRKASNKGSVADQIVFLLPTKNPEQKTEKMSFVLDRLYGNKTSDVLLAHVLAVYKKYQALKKRFPETPLSITITDAALTSAGISAENFSKKLQEKIEKTDTVNYEKTLETNFPVSSLGDNYIEFGSGQARQTGERIFDGLIIDTK